ncbi:hypothetical protein MRB53_037689 [Persea americana]|nr:hypothetical protein MRB53_037689 [Persea americana]
MHDRKELETVRIEISEDHSADSTARQIVLCYVCDDVFEVRSNGFSTSTQLDQETNLTTTLFPEHDTIHSTTTMTSLTLLEPPRPSDPAHTQAILSEAPKFLSKQRNAIKLPYPLNLLVSDESQEKWVAYENILVASIDAKQTEIAKQCIEEITERFGSTNERVIIFKGMYDEAVATNDGQLNAVLKRYDEVLTESPTLFGVKKRKVALLKSLGKTTEAITTLTEILDASPTDAECWVELSDLYLAQGALDQAIFCLEEVLLVMPNAWNIHAKLGELLYLNSNRFDSSEKSRYLTEAVRRYCRSVELCSDYLRGFYGLKLVCDLQCAVNKANMRFQTTTKLLSLPAVAVEKPSKTQTEAPIEAIPVQTLQKLNELATARLAEIVRRGKAGEKGWDGYDQAELLAAQELLSQGQSTVAR